MAIKFQYQDALFDLIVWEITETLDFFIEALQLPSTHLFLLEQKYSNEKSLLEWMASRYALQQLFHRSHEDFKKNKQGKLELHDHPEHLSISHTDNFVAVAKSPQPIGIDIQIPTPKLQRIAPKYIDSTLLAQLQATTHYLDYLHLYWGIKEALFKAYGLGQLNFIQHLHISPFDFESKGTTRAQIIKPNFEATYQVFYEKTENYYLCTVTKE